MTQRTAGYAAALLIWTFMLVGCASLTTPMDPPNVSMESFTSLPSEGGAPRFLIKLRVQNPNEQPLDIAGISYAIELVGTEVVTGVSKDIPVIDGYSEGVVSIEASLKLFQVLKLLASAGDDGLQPQTYLPTSLTAFDAPLPENDTAAMARLDIEAQGGAGSTILLDERHRRGVFEGCASEQVIVTCCDLEDIPAEVLRILQQLTAP